MSMYYGSHKVKRFYFGTQNTNCLTHIPEDIKLDLDPVNVSVTGSPTVNSGVASGFSTSSYVKTTGLDKTTTSFVAVFKTKITTHKSYNVILTFANSNYKIGFNSAGQLCTALGSWSAGTTKYATGTNIWVRLDWDGSSYKLYGLVDNGYTKHTLPALSSWTLEKTVSNTTFYKGDLSIGFNSTTTSEYFRGSIDVSQSFVNINGSNAWKGGTGKLTLKAGSKVYVPNGFEDDGTTPKFDEIVIESDVTGSHSSNVGSTLVTLNREQKGFNFTYLSSSSSGSSFTPATYSLYYDTANNTMKRYGSSTSSYTSESLPLGIVTSNKGFVTSIDQVFNGAGFIGSHDFVLPKIKVLFPNGINPDGTYKSEEFEVQKVLVGTSSGTRTRFVSITDQKEGGYLSSGVYYYKQSTAPAIDSSNYERWFSTNENKTYWHDVDETTWKLEDHKRAVIGEVVSSSGKITSVTLDEVQPKKIGREINRIYKGSTLVYGYKPSEVIFEKSTSGTATVNIEYDGYYELTVIGGGSGGAFEYSAKYADGAAAGGSGAGLIGVAYLEAGSYSITVGAGGAGAWDNNSREWISATAGGASKFGSIVTANGGTAATARYNNGSQTAGQGGTVSYTASAFRSVSLNKQGNAGATATNASTSATYSGGESVYGGYGAGGKAQYGGAYAGGNGYVKVVAI